MPDNYFTKDGSSSTSNYISNSVCIGLVHPKSPSNVGAVMRAAGCYGVQAIYYTGDRYDRAKKFNTDTKNAGQHVPLLAVDDLISSVPENTRIVCVELALGARLLPQFRHPNDVLYIFGPEDNTIEQNILKNADAVVYVPTIGCMNLAATVNVVLYDRLAKSDLQFANDDFIRASRDNNNGAKV